MNTILLTGTVSSEPRRRTATSETPKLDFYVETLTKSLPLRFWIIAFGQLAESLNLAVGDGVIVIGRLEPNVKDGRVAGFSLLANAVERLEAV